MNEKKVIGLIIWVLEIPILGMVFAFILMVSNQIVEVEKNEISEVPADLRNAVDKKTYIPQTPTADNPALSDDYIFDTKDENLVLKDLKREMTWSSWLSIQSLERILKRERR